MSDQVARPTETRSLAQIGARAFFTLSAVIAVLVPLWLWFTWVNTERTHLHRTRMIASLVAGYADNYLRYAGTELTRLGEALRRAQVYRDPHRSNAIVERFAAAHPDLVSITLRSPEPDTAARDRASGAGLAVDPPRYDERRGTWVVPIRQAVRDARGHVAFSLESGIALQPPYDLWRHFRQADNATVGLAWNDGRLLSRAPGEPAAYGGPGFNEGLTRALGMASEGAFRGADATGVVHYGGYMRLEHFPVYAFLSFPRASVADVWWRGARIPLLVMLIVLVGAAVIHWRLGRRLTARLVHVRQILEQSTPDAPRASGVREIDELCSALVESKEKLRLAADNREHKLLSAVQAGTFDVRVDDDVIVGANPRFLELLGRDPGVVIGKPWSEILPLAEASNDAGIPASDLTRRLVAVPHGQGSCVWLAIAEYQEQHNGKTLRHGLALDVSERERLLLGVRQQSEQFHLLWRIANDHSTTDTEKLALMMQAGLEALGMDAVVVSERTDSAVVVHFRLDPHALLGGDDGSGTPEGVADTPFGQRQRRGVRAHLRAPIRVGAEPCGTLEFFRRAPVTTELRPDQQQLLELLASWLGQVFAHRRRHGELENMALTDSLTSLPNRRAAESWFIQELARAKHSGDRIAIALVDLDHFKLINDQHGHDAGDAVLRQVAMTMKRVLREGDWIARWGGEEFLVFLHAAGARDVLAVAERLRAAVAAHPVSTANGPVDVTSSVGVCTARGGDIDMETLLAEADRALYRAKRGGRDRIVARRVGG